MKKILLIVNPVAGKMKARSTLLDVIKELQNDDTAVTVKLTSKRGEASFFANKAAEEGYDEIVCFGGDGTLNETMTGLMQSGKRVPLGYIPAGSCNDFAASMKLSNTPKVAAANVTNGKSRMIDIGLFDNERYFSYVAAFGVFTAASYSAPQNIKNLLGHMAYILEGIKEIGNIRSYHARIVTDERTLEGDYMFCAVANSTSVAGIVKLDDDLVDMSDGLFEIGLIKKPTSIAELNHIIQAITTSNFSLGGIEFYKASKVTFESDEDIEWTLDGEHAHTGKTVTVENIKQAIEFIK